MLARSPLLVHGLRSVEPADDAAEAGDRGAEDVLWLRASEALLSRWPQPTPSASTASAERGLGISSTPYYFFVMRAHRTFGFVVFLFEDVGGDVSMPPNAVGATPFDSGGLWIGAIDPITDDGAKRGLSAAEEVALARWKSDFLAYLSSNYPVAQDYVRGEPPRIGIRPITNRNPPNEARAWTWEVRYPSDLASARLRLERAYMHGDDYEDYVDWLPRSGYEDAEIVELAHLVEQRVEVHSDDSMAYVKAQVALRRLI